MRITSNMQGSLQANMLLNGMGGQAVTAAQIMNGDAQLNALLVSAARFVTNALPQAAGLRQSLAAMQNILDRETAVSSNTDVLRVKSFEGRTVPETSVLVYQLATSQRNEGTSMRADSRAMPPGTYRFEIEIDGKRHNISFTTREELTNRAFQQAMADAVNQAEIGINASVSTVNNQSRLVLESSTGAPQNGEDRFTIRDISGNAVEFTGADSVAQQGQDAIFYVDDGERQTSRSNDIDLGGGLTVTLVGVSEEAASISVGRDAFGARTGVRQIVNQFNALLETARANSTDRNTRALTRDLELAIRRSRRSLREVGVDINRDGYLVINEDRLRAASENGALERFLGSGDGRPSGFVESLSRVAGRIADDPMRHISRHVTRLPAFNAALVMAREGDNRSQTPTPFDAYFMNDALSSLFNTTR